MLRWFYTSTPNCKTSNSCSLQNRYKLKTKSIFIENITFNYMLLNIYVWFSSDIFKMNLCISMIPTEMEQTIITM